MRKLLYFFIIIMASIHSFAQPSEDIRPIVKKYINAYPDGTQISIGIYDSGKEHYYGFVKDSSSLATIDNHKKVFEIGSITKVFTSALLAKSIRDGVLSKETTASEILGFVFKDSMDVNMLQLSNHTGGMERIPGNGILFASLNPDNPYAQYSEDLLLEYLKDHLIQSPKNQKSEYSNLGAGLLGYCLSKKYKKSFEELLQENILIPLKMSSSTTQKNKIKQYLIAGIKEDGSPAKNWDFNVLKGAGAILSNTEDMIKFSKAVIKGKLPFLQDQLKKTFAVNEYTDIGMAWHILNKQNGIKIYWHNGGTGGYSSMLMLDPKTEKAVIILSNISAFHPNARDIERLAMDIWNMEF